MKTTLSLSCFLIIFIFTLTIHSPPSTAQEEDCNQFVCDVDWNHIKTGQPYRIGPPDLDQVGEISLESTIKDNACPRNAIILDKGQYGEKFIITPYNVTNDDRLLPLETPFSIAAVEKGSCNETGILRMQHKTKKLKFWHVIDDGYFYRGPTCFQFINFPAPTDPNTPTYLLQNCPSKCNPQAAEQCFDVGNRTADGYNYLQSGGYPFEFAFREVIQSDHFDQ